MHGNIDAALRWQKKIIKLCTKQNIRSIQSQADPCMLYKGNKTGKQQLIVAVHVNDVLISGKGEEMHKIKIALKQTFKIINLGKLRRHLGI